MNVNEDNIYTVDDNITGYRMMKMKHGDFFLTGLISLLDSDEFSTSGLYSAGVVQSVSAHIYFHESNEYLIPIIDDVLREMDQEGLLEEFRQQSGL